jgi:hypothetical protein
VVAGATVVTGAGTVVATVVVDCFGCLGTVVDGAAVVVGPTSVVVDVDFGSDVVVV